MGKVITVWGSPGSGKSMFSCILAKALTRDKRKAIIINAEISVPMLPVWLPEQIIQTNASVGQVLSSVEIDTSLVASHVMARRSTAAPPKAGCSRPSNTAIPNIQLRSTKFWMRWSRWSWLTMPQRMMGTKPSILRRKLPMNNLNDIFFAPAANQDLTYEQILEDVQRYFAENHAATIAEAGDGNTDRASSLLKELMVQYIVKRKYAIKGLTTEELCEKLYEDMAGYSFLKKWIYKPGIEEVNINAYNDIEVIEAGGRSVKIPDKFSSPQHAIDVVRRMLNACGMVIDDTMPSVIGFLDKNVRISVDKTPIVDPEVGINASIRIVNQQTVSAQKLLDSGSATAEMLHFLTACIRYGVSVCIAGATGSGKTTIMAWLLSQVPDNRRLITIEEGSREFDLVKRDEKGNILNSVVHLLTRPSENPSLNINQDFLLERVLRKHPDVIGVGEMRSAAESLSAAESSRTGHTVCTTIHSNSCASTYRRMMTLAKRKYMMGDDVLMQIMVEAYPIIVFTKQLEDRSRKIMEIIEGESCEGERLIYRTLYSYNVLDNTVDADGRPLVVGRHTKVSEMSSSLQKRLLDNGISHKELDEFLEHDKEVLNGCRGFTSYASPSSPLDS